MEIADLTKLYMHEVEAIIKFDANMIEKFITSDICLRNILVPLVTLGYKDVCKHLLNNYDLSKLLDTDIVKIIQVYGVEIIIMKYP